MLPERPESTSGAVDGSSSSVEPPQHISTPEENTIPEVVSQPGEPSLDTEASWVDLQGKIDAEAAPVLMQEGDTELEDWELWE